MKIILTDDITAQRKADAKKYAGLRELSEFICKRIRGEIGDILLIDEDRVEGLILDWVKEVEKRIGAEK